MTSLFDPGKVRLRLRCRAGRVAAVEVASERPLVAGALRGQPADRAVALLPLMFSLCGRAQGTAARLALAAARGEAAATAYDASIASEIAGEHLWRLLVDWPRAVGLPAAETLFVEGRRRLAQADFPPWARERLIDAASIIEQLLACLVRLPEAKRVVPHFLPQFDAAGSLAFWPRLGGAFAAAPTHGGRAAETGALARNPAAAGDRPIADRVRARVNELLSMAPGRAGAVTVAAGIGRAVVETARGPLMHELTLEGDRIADYVIVAPTEWNFHPEGPLRDWLSGLPADLAAELAPRAVLALDPCVPWTLESVAD